LRAQRERVWWIGVLMALAADDLQSAARVAAFAQGLEQLGWSIGSNVRLDYRWATRNADAARKHERIVSACAGRHPGER
jgi:putative ABC transport system substrate-binding protein